MSSNPDAAGSGAASVAEAAALRPIPVKPGARAEGRPPRFEIGPRVYRAARVRPYSPQPGDPLVRPLRIFTLDPATSVLDGAVAEVDVPYEPVAPGPVGALFEIDPVDGVHGVRYRAVDLDDPRVLIRVGRDPSVSDPEFHQQMVYAVASLVYAAFRGALGRDVAWGFKQPAGPADAPLRLRLRPHAFAGANAFYDPATGSIAFGYYPAVQDVAGRNLPGGYVFTCLSHDVVVHEVTHALLDGLRAHFASPTGRDVLAFHESFADLIAVFQHFSYPQVVLSAIRQSRGDLLAAGLLTGIATQFGHTTGSKQPLRTAIDVAGPEDAPLQYADAGDEPHERGRVLTGGRVRGVRDRVPAPRRTLHPPRHGRLGRAAARRAAARPRRRSSPRRPASWRATSSRSASARWTIARPSTSSSASSCARRSRRTATWCPTIRGSTARRGSMRSGAAASTRRACAACPRTRWSGARRTAASQRRPS